MRRVSSAAIPAFSEQPRSQEMIAELYPMMVIAAMSLFAVALLTVSVTDQLSSR
jgi:hypothetical protein